MVITAKERIASGIYALIVSFLALLALPAPTRAGDFPDDVKRTFTTDIPHFCQDDIPCAFGGKPTIGTKRSCNAPSHSAAARHKAATSHKTKRTADKRPATKPGRGASPSDQASAGASAGATVGTATTPSPAP